MTNKQEHIESAIEKAKKPMGALGISGIVGTAFVFLILLGQLSGGISFLGDWRASDKAETESELLHKQQHKNLDAMIVYSKHLCQMARDNGDKSFDCTKL